MAATIIQFPQTHSNIFLNLTQLINLASDNQVVEEYAEIMAVCHEEGNFKPDITVIVTVYATVNVTKRTMVLFHTFHSALWIMYVF